MSVKIQPYLNECHDKDLLRVCGLHNVKFYGVKYDTVKLFLAILFKYSIGHVIKVCRSTFPEFGEKHAKTMQALFL